jgi:hypothetical protein
MRVLINGSVCVYDDEPPGTIEPTSSSVAQIGQAAVPFALGASGTAAAVMLLRPYVAFAADPGARLIAKEQSIIHTLQSIAVPASIAIAIWGLIEWAVLNNPHGKRKIWDSLWLLIGIKFIPDIWQAIAS